MRTIAFLCAASAFIGAAQAQTVLPDVDWEIVEGSWMSLETSTAIGATCDKSGWGTSDAATGTGTVEALDTSGGFICNYIVTGGLPSGLTADTSTTPAQVTSHDGWADTSIGRCEGDVTGDWIPDDGATEQAGSGVLIFDQSPWGSSGCLLSGEIYVEWPRDAS